MRPVPEAAVDLVARWEGCELQAYCDLTGVLTIGYGHTGPDVHAGQIIDKPTARALLRADLEIAARRLIKKVGPVVDELTDNQYAALLSLVFNLGTGDPRRPEWLIWKLLRGRHFDQVHLQFGKFVNAGGRKVQGLVNRRSDEARIWSLGEPGSDDVDIPSSVTRAISTPPTPADPVPPQRSASVITGALAVVGTVPVAAKQVSEAIEPYRAASAWVQQAAALVASVAAIAAVAALVLTWMSKRSARV